jgi:hypothetical protein
VKQGPFFPILKARITSIEGFSRGGILEGPVLIRLQNGIVVHSKLRDGVLHGMTHSRNVRFTFPLADEFRIVDVNDPRISGYAPHVGLVAHFSNGRPEGVAWQALIGKGMLYGELHPDSRNNKLA